jgi:hypothetical protein
MLNHLMADNEVSVLTSEEVTSQMADVWLYPRSFPYEI